MSLPDEKIRAIKWGYRFMMDLLDTKKYKVPSIVRKTARSVLRHYPFDWEVDQYWKEDRAVWK